VLGSQSRLRYSTTYCLNTGTHIPRPAATTSMFHLGCPSRTEVAYERAKRGPGACGMWDANCGFCSSDSSATSSSLAGDADRDDSSASIATTRTSTGVVAPPAMFSPDCRAEPRGEGQRDKGWGLRGAEVTENSDRQGEPVALFFSIAHQLYQITERTLFAIYLSTTLELQRLSVLCVLLFGNVERANGAGA
jgi:hypothetical protein